MRAKITDRFIKENVLKGRSLPDQIFPPEKDVEIRDTSLVGLSLIVRKSSVLSFCLRYRNERGKARKYKVRPSPGSSGACSPPPVVMMLPR